MLTFYKPGDIIHQEKPFVKVVYYSERENYCDNCFSRVARSPDGAVIKLSICSSCKYVGYCQKQCQKLAWKQHKLECRHLKNLPERFRDFVRIAGLVLLCVQGKDWRRITQSVGGRLNRSFEDLLSNCHLTDNDPRLNLQYLEMVFLVKKYLGRAIKYNENQLREVIGKVKHNRFDVYEKGSALYLGGSLFEHACIPNSVAFFDGLQMTVRANREFSSRSMEDVTFAFSMIVVIGGNYTEMKNSFCRKCTCWDCSLPYGYSILTKIEDWTRAFSVIECTELALERVEEYFRNGVKSLNEEQLETLSTLLEMQKDVLGNTNLLRLRLLLIIAYYETDSEIREQSLRQLGNDLEDAFGPCSEEVLCVYQVLSLLYNHLQKYEYLSVIDEFVDGLGFILYGALRQI